MAVGVGRSDAQLKRERQQQAKQRVAEALRARGVRPLDFWKQQDSR